MAALERITMARKTKAEADQTRQQILDAALDVFSIKGYSHATFVDIAEAIGLSKGAVYWHFKTKEELLIALLEYGESMRPEAFDLAKITTLEDLRSMLYNGLKKGILVNKREQQFEYFCAFQVEWSSDIVAEARLKMMQMRSEHLHHFQSVFDHLHRAGVLPKHIDPARVVEHLVAAFTGGLTMALMGHITFERFLEMLDENFNMLMNFKMNGMTPENTNISNKGVE